MAFTNTWDTTFPPDTQLANLLGDDIRKGVKVDVQQRMAAISGLDAAKPNFAGDAQPANWNGILFFATDTGKIYQFNNPAWTDVTASLKAPTGVIYKNTSQVVHTGTTTTDIIFSTGLPILTNQSIIKISFMVHITAQGAPFTNLLTNINGTNFTQFTFNNSGTLVNTNIGCVHHIYNENSLIVQGSDIINTFRGADGNGGIATTNQGGFGAVNTAVGTTLALTVANGSNSDSQTFLRISVELL